MKVSNDENLKLYVSIKGLETLLLQCNTHTHVQACARSCYHRHTETHTQHFSHTTVSTCKDEHINKIPRALEHS